MGVIELIDVSQGVKTSLDAWYSKRQLFIFRSNGDSRTRRFAPLAIADSWVILIPMLGFE